LIRSENVEGFVVFYITSKQNLKQHFFLQKRKKKTCLQQAYQHKVAKL